MKINRIIKEGYKGPCKLIIISQASCNINEPYLLNGFKDETDLVPLVNENRKFLFKTPANIMLAWDSPRKMLCAVTKFIVKHTSTDEELLKLVEDTITQFTEGVGKEFTSKPLMTHEEKEVNAVITKEEVYATLAPVEIPEGYLWLGLVIDSPERQVMYEEFMKDPLVFERLRDLCIKARLNISEEVNSSVGLPIHLRDQTTGELLISQNTAKIFSEFQLAQNLMKVGTDNELLLGRLMMLCPFFSEYMLFIAEREMNGKEINQDNYEDQIKKAINFVQERGRLNYFD